MLNIFDAKAFPLLKSVLITSPIVGVAVPSPSVPPSRSLRAASSSSARFLCLLRFFLLSFFLPLLAAFPRLLVSFPFLLSLMSYHATLSIAKEVIVISTKKKTKKSLFMIGLFLALFSKVTKEC